MHQVPIMSTAGLFPLALSWELRTCLPANVNLRNGYNYDALIRATPDGADAYDPRYGMDDLFNEGLAARLGVKWSF